MLNQKQKVFCQYYITPGSDCFGNAVKSYLKAYGGSEKSKTTYSAAQVSSSRLLKDGDVMGYINNLLESSGFNTAYVDSELLGLIQQNENPAIKLYAIKEYNRISRRDVNNPLEYKMKKALEKFAEYLPDD